MGKVGGKTLSFYLKCHFGIGHLMVAHARNAPAYTREELKEDLQLNPWLRSIGGHMLRPYVDFGSIRRPLLWYTIMRDPIERSICHYQQQYHTGFHRCETLRKWFDKYPRRAYWQVGMLAGGKNLEKAKGVLLKKFVVVGINEHYEESLFLIAQKLGFEGFQFNDRRAVAVPPEVPEFDRRVREEAEEMKDELLERLSVDIELYRFARRHFFDRQIDAYGRERFAKDLDAHLEKCKRVGRLNCRYVSAQLFQKFVYMPIVRVRRFRAGRLSVSPETGRGFEVESSPGRMGLGGPGRRRSARREATAIYGGVQGPGGSGGIAGRQDAGGAGKPVQRASEPDH